MQRLQQMAELSVARGCGFASIAIFMSMIAYYGNAAHATKIGGILTLITCLVLLVRAMRAPLKPYKRTELWLMLTPDERPRPETAQRIIGMALHYTYLRFALYSGQISTMMLSTSLLLAWVAPS